ncbi:MAG TPA: 2OG-Fe(II) oxygenase [Rhizomicrobium sp.]|nr:2OG-Fe(II) oxygenase [Rhizomicrobium sp.]
MDAPLEQRAGAGDSEAQKALAHQFAAAARHDLARGWYARAAKAGDVAALRLLGESLLSQTPLAIADGIGMIRDAAERGDADALHLCAVLAAQDTQLATNLEVARDYLLRAAERGHDIASRQLRMLSDAPAAAPYAEHARRIDFARWLGPPPATNVFDDPRISVITGFASAAECDWLIARGRGRLEPAQVYDPAGKGARIASIRSNSAAAFNIVQSDLILGLLRARMARATGLSTDAMEPAMLLHYRVGEEFAPHFDFVEAADDIARNGQRVATVLIYLDEPDLGGETAFLDLGWRHRGAKGDALIFWNVEPGGAPDRRTRHAGLAPTHGEKWLLSQWIRGR